MKLYIGSDHAGFEMKETLKTWMNTEFPSIQIEDKGCESADSCDYADYAHAVAENVTGDSRGILLCGSANGVSIAANKHAGVRAALCWTEEIATLARQHNDANIICLPARFISSEEAFEITNIFLQTEFEGGRHQRRVEKIGC
jgi:ribose 5-phosphate isomerase B